MMYSFKGIQKWLRTSAVLICGLCIPIIIAANNKTNIATDSIFEAGNRLYMNHDYSNAAEAYLNIIKSGVISAQVYYNLGNSYFKMNKLGQAILYYEKAHLLSPNDRDIQNNLALAGALTIDKIEVIPQFFVTRWAVSLRNLLTPDQWAVFSIIAFCLMLSSLTFFFISHKFLLKKYGFISAIILLILTTSGLFCMTSRTKNIRNSGSAIILTSSVTARSSPDEQSTNVFVLHEGTKVMITDSLQSWKEIKLADGNQGWVPDDAIGSI